MEISGLGTLGVNPKSVDGGGVFVHRGSGGNVLGSGTWTATKLISFVDFGPTPAFTPDVRSGIANISVRLVGVAAGGGAVEFDAVLRIQCNLPDVIPSLDEGVRLNVKGGSNFNSEAGGATVFILPSAA